MINEDIHRDPRSSVQMEMDSAAQLRREAVKARILADAAFGEVQRRQLAEVATTLEREAEALERALASQRNATDFT